MLSSSIDAEAEFSEEMIEDLIVAETSAEAGQARTASFAAPAAGTYQVICSIPGHLAAGMEGRLIVSDT